MNRVNPALRQQELLLRSAELRVSIATHAQVLKRPLELVDKVRAGAQWVLRNPVIPLGVGLVLVMALPKRSMLMWGGRLWGAWAAYSRIRHVVIPEPSRSRRPRR